MKSVDRTALRAFLERPLFDPARRLAPARPIETAPPSVAMPPEPPPMLQLLGVIHGSQDMAIVRHGGGEKTMIVRTGDHFGAWTVTVLPPIGIRLKNGDRAFDYALFGKRDAAHSLVPSPDGPF